MTLKLEPERRLKLLKTNRNTQNFPKKIYQNLRLIEFSLNFRSEISKSIFSTEHFRTTASVILITFTKNPAVNTRILFYDRGRYHIES